MIDVGILGNEEMDIWHVIMLRERRSKDMIIWCMDYESDGKFGMGRAKFGMGRATFWFENESDASMFALMWV